MTTVLDPPAGPMPVDGPGPLGSVPTVVADRRSSARSGRRAVGATPPRPQPRIARTDPDGGGTPTPAAHTSTLPQQVARFAAVGVPCTLAYLALYLLLRPPVGPQTANAVAMLITTVANTAANRRVTFSRHGRDRALLHQVQGLLVFAVGLGMSAGALAAVHAANPRPEETVELGTLVAANLAAGVVRFVLLKSWVFHAIRH
jgi:putative flippase GtrA